MVKHVSKKTSGIDKIPGILILADQEYLLPYIYLLSYLVNKYFANIVSSNTYFQN